MRTSARVLRLTDGKLFAGESFDGHASANGGE